MAFEFLRRAVSYYDDEAPSSMDDIRRKIRDFRIERALSDDDGGYLTDDEVADIGERLRDFRQRTRGEDTFARSFELSGIEIVRGGAGANAGRVVEAYASVFDQPTEISDQHGRYVETIARSAFDDVLRKGTSRVKVFFNHGMDLAGRPSDRWSVPIGTPLDIRADGKGLRTITRFNEGEAGDQVLEAIRNQAITGYSFRGPIHGSEPNRVPRAREGMPLPEVRRTKLGLTEYGPAAVEYYPGAKVLAVRGAALDYAPPPVRPSGPPPTTEQIRRNIDRFWSRQGIDPSVTPSRSNWVNQPDYDEWRLRQYRYK